MPIEHPATDISIDPIDGFPADNVQEAVAELEERTGVDRFLIDRKVGFNLTEEFLGGGTYTAPGRIGQNGWSIPAGITGPVPSVVTTPPAGAFGVISLGTEQVDDWNNINLGTSDLVGAPVLHMQCRVRFTNLNSTFHRQSVHIGLHSDIGGIEPATGLYFRYMQEGSVPLFRAVVANGGSRTADVVGGATPVTLNSTSYYWLEISSDGSGVIRFYVDGAETNMINTNLPSGSNRYGPSITIRRTLANATLLRAIHVDSFDVRVEGER